MNLNSKVVRSNEPISAAVNDELVMMNAETGKYYGLNGIATAIWQAIESEITVGELCSHLQKDFDVQPERCTIEVLEFLIKLSEKNLINVVE